ncbi:MAG: hypothetical protein ACTHLW_21010, partial [Verrucomicrobiota bacterium]
MVFAVLRLACSLVFSGATAQRRVFRTSGCPSGFFSVPNYRNTNVIQKTHCVNTGTVFFDPWKIGIFDGFWGGFGFGLLTFPESRTQRGNHVFAQQKASLWPNHEKAKAAGAKLAVAR